MESDSLSAMARYPGSACNVARRSSLVLDRSIHHGSIELLKFLILCISSVRLASQHFGDHGFFGT